MVPPVQALALHPQVPSLPHLTPQLPQLFGSAEVCASQPFATLLSQFLNPALHTMEHTELEHDATPPAELHAVPQAPQLFTLVFRSVSQPFAGLPSQSPKPALQTGAQLLPTQLVVPWALVHCLPQRPQ